MAHQLDAFDLDSTDGLLTTTRAVRQRLDLVSPIDRNVILDCLRIAGQSRSRRQAVWSPLL